MTPEPIGSLTPTTEQPALPQPRLRAELAWNLFTELRKELVEAQSLRTRVIGLKVTFVSAAAAVVAGLDDPEPLMIAIPAVAAVFFDVLINSYSFSVKTNRPVRPRVPRACSEGGVRLRRGHTALAGLFDAEEHASAMGGAGESRHDATGLRGGWRNALPFPAGDAARALDRPPGALALRRMAVAAHQVPGFSARPSARP